MYRNLKKERFINIPEGISVGIEKNSKSVLQSMKDLTSDLTSQAQIGIGIPNRLRGARLPISGLIPSTAFGGVGTSSTTNNSNVTQEIHNHYHQTIESPSELARKQKQQMQRLALEWGT